MEQTYQIGDKEYSKSELKSMRDGFLEVINNAKEIVEKIDKMLEVSK